MHVRCGFTAYKGGNRFPRQQRLNARDRMIGNAPQYAVMYAADQSHSASPGWKLFDLLASRAILGFLDSCATGENSNCLCN